MNGIGPAMTIPHGPVIHSLSPEMLGPVGTLIGSPNNFASTTWPANNYGLFLPLRLDESITALKLGVAVGSVASGNVDLGIYDESGTLIVAKGYTAFSASFLGVTQILDITDTRLGPGRFFLAIVCSSTGSRVRCASMGAVQAALSGVKEVTGLSSGLPSSVTYAVTTSSLLPWIGLSITTNWG